jgi:hypothetical protein
MMNRKVYYHHEGYLVRCWFSFGEKLLDFYPTPKLEEHPSFTVHDCLFNKDNSYVLPLSAPSHIHDLISMLRGS